MEQSIQEGNRLIAEFDMLSMVEGGFYSIAGYLRTADELQYHSSWDWLMPVYQKICVIVDDWAIEDTDKYGEGLILYNIAYERIGDGEPITEAFSYIVQFINWYNKTKS